MFTLRAESSDVRGYYGHRQHGHPSTGIRSIESFHPLSKDEVDALLAKTREAAATGRFEPFKTSSIFDSTAENPQWLGEEPPEIRQLMPA